MNFVRRFTLGHRTAMPPWNDGAPVRDELFSVERLEQHAETLAAAQPVTADPPRVLSLHRRLDDNAAVLLAAYRASAAELESGRGMVPAAEWLLDNYHIVEEQIREVRDDLPPGYYRQLPKVAEGPFAGYPRVFGIGWAFVAHTDSHLDPETLRRFIAAYQQVQPLTIGELWAVAITLRIVLVENLRRLVVQIRDGQEERAAADALADRILRPGHGRAALDADIATRDPGPLSEIFAAQLAKRLRDLDPRTTPALGWLEDRLARQGVSIDEVVQNAQHRQGASNVSVRNVITSMRAIVDIDWAEMLESVSLVDARLRDASAFAAMDFPTRNMYRSAIELLARGSQLSELEIVERALKAARIAAAAAPDAVEAERVGDPGHHLIGGGRGALEDAIGFRPPWQMRLGRWNMRVGIGGYIGVTLIVTAVLLGFAFYVLAGAGIGWLLLFTLFAFLPASDVATTLVNRAITMSAGARILPGIDLAKGVPSSLRTLVAVPALLGEEAELLEQIERLEVHHLASAGGDISFALLLDGVDADREILPDDARFLAVAADAMAQLNNRYGPGPGGDRFLLLYRRRVFNPDENNWMGWERKRGKLHELNRLLRGAHDTTFVAIPNYMPELPRDVRYVITLDADTRLPRDIAARLIGKMAHPLNRPNFSDTERRVVDGYAILQPRVTPSLPVGLEGSHYLDIFTGPGGVDPYASAVSDVYQDLFGEGSYTGKGIYDVDAFEAALDGRVPENALLSHDLFEGIFARAGLASDVEVIEEFPSRYDVAAKRQHRWTRGDWQLLSWVIGRRSRHVPMIGRAKMLDNLRRSLLAPSSLIALALCWLLATPLAVTGSLLVFAAIAIPALLPVLFSVLPQRPGTLLRHHIGRLATDLHMATARVLLTLAFLPDQAWRMGDAILRTLLRLFVTRRHLLEWTTAAQAKRMPVPTIIGFYREMAGGLLLSLAVAGVTIAATPASWPLILLFALLWLAAPALAFWASRSAAVPQQLLISESDAQDLRLVARRTWRFFETFVTADDHMLPPDNFQEDPAPIVARRTSPTNIGLYLLSAVAARDFGWAGTMATLDRLEATFATMLKLPRFNGHFYNWYATRDLQVLGPGYISSVDSGNLAGHLIAIANACEEWMDAAPLPEIGSGMADNLRLARTALAALPASQDEPEANARKLRTMLDEIAEQLDEASTRATLLPDLLQRIDNATGIAWRLVEGIDDDTAGDLLYWLEAMRRLAVERTRDREQIAEAPRIVQGRLRALADTARAMAFGMDFAFLIDPERRLLSLGFSLGENGLDPSCYDLLASEARLASLFAIAKGDAPTKHWLHLGRAATPVGTASALISWSGSMFEYLMPSLVMRAPAGSLLEQTNRLVVGRQQSYGRSLGVPWGMSESAYNARDKEFTYQYANFGIPGLGLKRGLSEDIVIAPYATGLAAMVDPHGAMRNFDRLAAIGARGRYGFYEALDYTPSRLPEGAEVAIVRTYMAHHQGMTIVAIANALQNGRMRSRFHREPMIQASELLLQERMPRDVAVARPRVDEVHVSAIDSLNVVPTLRRLTGPIEGAPVTHLLSNGRYAVMLTATGSGYSRWRDIAVTRWREDPTRDDWGSLIFLRDVQRGHLWSPGAQRIGATADQIEVMFGEDHAEFVRRDGNLTTAMEVVVSDEADGEVRRLSLTNSGRRPREIEVTSYAELVLAPPASDNAHPVFSKMFVETEFLPAFDAIVATRRLRSPDEPQFWAAHFTVVEGERIGAIEYETDRARFLGRCHTVETAVTVVDGRPLGGNVGTVLDPVFALRHRVRVAPGKVVRIAFWTIVAASRTELLDLIDKHNDRSAFDRARTLAWTQAQVQLRYLDIDAREAADYQRLAAPILYADLRFRAPPDAIVRGANAQSRLWPLAISGDLPIVLLRIDDVEDIGQVSQLLRALEYWRIKGLGVDLVIVNERASSYTQELQIAIETAVRSSQSRPRLGGEHARGSVYTLRADLMDFETRTLLQSVARVALVAHRGPIADQLARLPLVPLRRETDAVAKPVPLALPALPPPLEPDLPELEFFNGIGGFDKDGSEYVAVLEGGRTTPAPWINVVSNPEFGFQVSADGSGYSWAENSRENQLTPWSNDPVGDPAGEALYIRDEATGALWSATAQPIRGGGRYVARHGFGYSRFEHEAHGIASELLQYVPLADPVRIARLTLENLSNDSRRLSVTAYAEWVLGSQRAATAPFIVTGIDARTGAMVARNPWSMTFPGRVAFSDLAGKQTGWTADRTEFLGRNGTPTAPASLVENRTLSGAIGAGLDPCSALQQIVELAPGERIEIVWLLGETASADQAAALIGRYRRADLDAVLEEVAAHWRSVLGAVTVKTPDRALDIMLNGWLLYQTLACRLWARSAFYQASGAYGFRDQLQDGMSLTFARPQETRRHILRAAGRQFVEGDVQHWWLPHSGQGVRTRISDDRVWLGFATATYIRVSGDEAILDEIVPFLEGPMLEPGQHDAFFQPMIGDEPASLFRHCARALDHVLILAGDRGLPLIGGGDWNDSMNRVGIRGRGESVWLAWILLRTLDLFAALADTRDPGRAGLWRAHAEVLRAAIEKEAWDGEWYRRATFDDGTWLGSKTSEACRIDSIAQSWSVLSKNGDPARAAIAMASLEKHLVDYDDRIAALFVPPFDRTELDPGYIRGYPPGVRENGGQYSHAVMWAASAFAQMGDGDRAFALLDLANPINHARSAEGMERYRVEPYVLSADVYSVPPHRGRGGWSWYTGSAGLMQRAGIEDLLGIRREGATLIVDPCIPRAWPGYEATVTLPADALPADTLPHALPPDAATASDSATPTRYEIRVVNPAQVSRRIAAATLDDAPLELVDGRVHLPLDGGEHRVTVTLGE
ncbi:MAG: glucoamylase family protein [Dongiaceae bacterium]